MKQWNDASQCEAFWRSLRHVLPPPASSPQTQATRVSETALLNNNNAQVADALAESNWTRSCELSHYSKDSEN